jgi:DNA-binding response OmpR family regulator
MSFASFVPSPGAKEPPDTTFVTDRVADNHVVTLRKKVEPEPSEPRYIVSVRGLGYRFDG